MEVIHDTSYMVASILATLSMLTSLLHKCCTMQKCVYPYSAVNPAGKIIVICWCLADTLTGLEALKLAILDRGMRYIDNAC